MTLAVGPAIAQDRGGTGSSTGNSAPSRTGDTATTGTGGAPPATTGGRPSKGTSSGAVSSRAFDSGIASPVTATNAGSAPAAAANAVAYYGSWLDDASLVAPGDLWVGLATGYWRGTGSRQIDAPVASIAAGINSRMHIGGSMSFYHFRDPDGLSVNGFGSVSTYTKFVLADPSRADGAIGVAVTPLLEFSPGEGDQIGWALPINIESRHRRLRLYGSAGYFSRGSIFGTIAADIPISPRVSVTGSFGQAYARAGAHQRSLGIGTLLTMTSTTAIFVGVGQTFMPAETNPGGLSFACGLSLFVSDPSTP